MMIKINSKESVEIVEDVFVNVINEAGSQYKSWDELTEKQQECFTRLSQGIRDVYEQYRDCLS